MADGGTHSLLRSCILITACVFAAFYPTLHNGYIWDDDDYETKNSTLHSGEGLGHIWLDPNANWQ